MKNISWALANFDANHWILLREKVDIASGDWASYPTLLCCGNNIIAVDAEGQMYAWSLSDSFELAEKRTLSSGWNQYDYLFEVQDNLMAVDKNGDVHKLANPAL